MKYKMSDEFALPWSSYDYQNHIADSLGSFVLFSDMDWREKDALCHAVNNHDRLTEQVAELKALLELAGGMGFNVATSESSVTHRDYCKRVDKLLKRIGEDNA